MKRRNRGQDGARRPSSGRRHGRGLARESRASLGLALSITVLGAALGCSSEAEPGTGKSAGGRADAPEAERHTSWRRARVLVGDGRGGSLHVIDIEDEEVIAELDAGGPAALHGTESGDYAVAVGAEEVRFIRSGVAIVDHTDHIHIYKSPPKVLDLSLPGASPGAFVSREAWLSIFFDGTGQGGASAQAVLVKEPSLNAEEPEILSLPPVEPHRGLAAPLGDTFLVSFPPEDEPGGLPLGLNVLSAGGEVLEGVSSPCPGLRGQAAIGEEIAFACDDGLLLVGRDGGTTTARKLSYPRADARSFTLRSHVERTALIGDFGESTLIEIEPADGAARFFDLPAPVCHFELEPGRGEQAIALAADGNVYVLDLATAKIAAHAAAVPAFQCDDAVRPGLALAPDYAYVTDPTGGEVHEIGLRSLTITRSYQVGGAPSAVVMMGLNLKNVNVAPGAAHD
ncbi:hypothetical protein [Sorangium cellulosum]|uniref:Uncharacterized protein n=1 Tax=Sorangium cellulosum So0157-2 TaxID=1254432 RepID=S4YAN5_SORCE|nr:hypothetical protein [Sorangium cellulosum]AGP41370.1 hypothetical protein SCE1572_46920 [Sorangium cellulosum So0157-2]